MSENIEKYIYRYQLEDREDQWLVAILPDCDSLASAIIALFHRFGRERVRMVRRYGGK